MLLARRGGGLPIGLAGAWDDLEQGWWASAIPAGSRVYLAETDFDELVDKAREPSNISPRFAAAPRAGACAMQPYWAGVTTTDSAERTVGPWKTASTLFPSGSRA
jgi:hypothetical protein